MNTAEIDAEYKVRFKALQEEVGQWPTFFETEKLQEWYKAQHEAANPTNGSDGDRQCIDCNEALPPHPGRGRKPVRCDNCKGVVKQEPVETVQLTMPLRRKKKEHHNE